MMNGMVYAGEIKFIILIKIFDSFGILIATLEKNVTSISWSLL